MDAETILASYPDLPEPVVSLIRFLVDENKALKDRVRYLEGKLNASDARLAANSQNSSKPPSSDGYQKAPTVSTRKPSGKRPGGQPNHPSNTLKKVQQPDHIIIHEVNQCATCGTDLSQTEATPLESRQVYDLPPVKIEVTEHQITRKCCTHCGQTSQSQFPKEIPSAVQYGAGLQSFCTYLYTAHHLPYNRIQETIRDVYNHTISTGTIHQFLIKASKRIGTSLENIQKHLLQSPILHVDETGCRVDGHLTWVHVASNDRFTYYDVQEKRGKEAMDQIGLLPRYQGTLVHDHWKPYYQYFTKHILCNAHHLRELKALYELHQQKWAKEMIELLVRLKREVDEFKSHDHIPKAFILESYEQYCQVLKKGFQANPIPEKIGNAKPKKTATQRLLHRLDKHCDEVLAFVRELNAPFDNNQAERDIRMVKLRQKISGCFRSFPGARLFCRLRSYLSTVKKQKIPLLEAIRQIFQMKPIGFEPT